MIADACQAYFLRNPYDTWFKRLDHLLAGLRVSYYSSLFCACHLDLVPYATAAKWTNLTKQQRDTLLESSGDTLTGLISDSPIRVLILNGASVVQHFEAVAETRLDKVMMPSWTLRRLGDAGVAGFSYSGVIRRIGGSKLKRSLHVLGFNHNIQSSFGVTKQVTDSIGRWITGRAATIA
jgi:hypothetical protein